MHYFVPRASDYFEKKAARAPSKKFRRVISVKCTIAITIMYYIFINNNSTNKLFNFV